jgi:proteic killer suppression protein
MIISFGNKLTSDLYAGLSTKETRSFQKDLQKTAIRKLAQIHAVFKVEDLGFPPGNKLEKLKGDLKEYYSIRINNQWRITFRFNKGNAYEVKIEDYH